MSVEPIIQFEQVSFGYNGVPVLHGVNLALRHGDFVCVLGPNGGGKTTLVKLMLGLLRPQAGRVLVLGEPPQEVLKRIGYMPQRTQFDPRFPVTVLDVTLMGRLGRSPWIGPYRARDKQLALQALTEVGMADLVRRPLASLSGGQRQRVLIARALACDPEILILDEPMAGLDPAAQEDLYGLLGKLNQRLTIVMVSHDIGFVSLYFNTVVCVDRHVHVHPTGELTGKRIADMYGREVRLLHDGLAKNTKPPAGGTP